MADESDRRRQLIQQFLDTLPPEEISKLAEVLASDAAGGSEAFDRQIRGEAARLARRRGLIRANPLYDALHQRSQALYHAGEQERLFQVMDAVIEHLRHKWGEHRECPYCRASDWQVGKLMWLETQDGAEYPAVPVLCVNCANTTFINPLAAGIDLSGLVDEDE